MWSDAVVLTSNTFFFDAAAKIVSFVEVHEVVGLASDDRIRIT